MERKQLIRSIPDGGMLTFPMSEDLSLNALRQRCLELNKIDGWLHYSIVSSNKTKLITILANEKPEGGAIEQEVAVE